VNRSAVPPPVTRVLDAAHSWLPREMAAVERRLGDVVDGHGERLAAEAAMTLAAGGKRLRPLLVLLCAGPDAGEGARRGATAVELIHMATLVHDDVLDDAPLRRGQPTVFARAGRGAATAVGDLLLSRAFAELTGQPDPPAARRRVRLLTDAAVALARGELAQRRDAYDVGLDAERYMRRCRLKTAALFECACTIGSSPSGQGKPDDDDTLIRFGGEIGLAFQLLDDVLDVAGPPERTGKARGTDLLDGTVTLPLILARERDPSLGGIDLRGLGPTEAERVCDRIAATGALDVVRRDARDRVEAAKRALHGADLDPERRELLELVADGVVERYS
jgi:geranylgeranyl pyrophosphate synthase